MFNIDGEKSKMSNRTTGLSTLIENCGINDNLVSRCHHIWSGLEKVSAKVEGAVTSAKPTNLEVIRQFEDVVRNYRNLFRKHLRQAVNAQPCDNEVEKIVNAAECHLLFRPSQLKLWIDWKQEQSEMANVIGEVKGVIAFLKKRQLKQELANFAGKHALVLNIPQLDQETDKILSSMKDNEDPFTNMSMQIAVGVPWYMDQEKRKFVLDKIRELVKHMENNKHLEGQVKFFLTSSKSTEDFRCYYSIYEADKLVKDKLDRLPSSPIGLKFRTTETSLVCISWSHEELCYPYKFIVEYRSELTFLGTTTDKSEIQFKPGPEMEVRVAMESLIGRSKFSDVLLVPVVAKQLPPNVKSVTESTAELEWIPPSVGGKFSYLVKFWSNNPGSFVQELVDNKTDCLMTNVFPGTTYNVNIDVETEDGQQNILPSEILQFTTSKAKEIRFAETILTSCKKMDVWNNLVIYTVPVTKITQPDSYVDRFFSGQPILAFGRNTKQSCCWELLVPVKRPCSTALSTTFSKWNGQILSVSSSSKVILNRRSP